MAAIAYEPSAYGSGGADGTAVARRGVLATADRLGDRRPPAGRPLRLVAAPVRRPSAAVLRRRRLLAMVLLLVVVLVSMRLLEGVVGASGHAGGALRLPTVVAAQPGDTYWSLATRLDAGGDIRSTVDSLVRANGGRELQAGDRLQLVP